MDAVVVYVPRCFQNGSESLGFKVEERKIGRRGRKTGKSGNRR
jgi:hypothetical protein